LLAVGGLTLGDFLSAKPKSYPPKESTANPLSAAERRRAEAEPQAENGFNRPQSSVEALFERRIGIGEFERASV